MNPDVKICCNLIDFEDTPTVYTVVTDATVCVPSTVVDTSDNLFHEKTSVECHVLHDLGEGWSPEEGKSMSE